MAIATINPATGETITTFTPLTTEEIELKLAVADATYEKYRQTSLAQRSQWLNNAAAILERDQDKFAKIMTLEMGKPLQSAIAEVKKCAWVCRFYAEKAPEFLADKAIATDATRSYVSYQPFGNNKSFGGNTGLTIIEHSGLYSCGDSFINVGSLKNNKGIATP